MSIDHKIAKHMCNVIRRQVQNALPDLYMEFILHETDKRKDAFLKEKDSIKKHPAGNGLINYMQDPKLCEILKNNKSQFVVISYHKTHSFLGLLHRDNYAALCFINYNEFENKEHLRNHVLHIAWHAINLYQSHIKSGDKANIIPPPPTTTALLQHNNLMADIFSASVQFLQGRGDALISLAKQRSDETLFPKFGVFAEETPFPVCLDTLDFIFSNDINQYKNSKEPVISALNIASKTGDTFDKTSIEQWNRFSLPAQEMAWMGRSPNTILGAALYTSEDAYVQSIADMMADKMKIKPQAITSLQDYNPFADNQTNEYAHQRQCEELISNLLDKVNENGEYEIFIEVAKKQNQHLLECSPMGWCASSLIAAANAMKENTSNDLDRKLVKEAFHKGMAALPWDSLKNFAQLNFKYKRSNITPSPSGIINTAKSMDEFSPIIHALLFTKNFN